MNRFAIGAVATLLALATANAAPVPKDAGKPDPTPDIAAALDTAARAVKAGKWPSEIDEKGLKDTAQKVFERALKAADKKERPLPVDFAKLTKLDVTANYKATSLDSGFLVAGDVQVTGATNSVIFASGDVKITSATNCVIVARNVRCTGIDNCTVVAGDFIRLTSARPRNGGDESVLVAGSWIRTTGMEEVVCHVIRPTGQPAPDDGQRPGPHPAIRTTGGKNITFLNAKDETGATRVEDSVYLPPKNPIAK